MPPTARAKVKPDLISWVREDAGLTVEQAAKKVSVSGDRFRSWEAGEAAPTIRQLKLLGKAAGRPLAVFYLSEPPKRFQAMKDFRRFPGDAGEEASPELRKALRTSEARRQIARDLYNDLDLDPPRLRIRIEASDDPAEAAARLRARLGVSAATQFGWSGRYDGFNGWRAALEAVGVLVFQASKISVQEMRGFSLSGGTLPAIVVNVRDAPNARVFSMMHELAHVALRDTGLCDLTEHSGEPATRAVEVFCNAVAGRLLVPDGLLAAQPAIRDHEGPDWAPTTVAALSRRFSVSRQVILRRLLDSDLTTRAAYEAETGRLTAATSPKRSGFAPPDTLAVAHGGPHFVKLVLRSYYTRQITSRDVSEYLGVRLKHLPRIEDRVWGESA